MCQPVLIDRYLSRERNVLFARGVFTPLFADYHTHSRKWVGEPDGLVRVMMHQGLAAAALYLTCRPTDEQTAWTVNLPEPPLNLFFAADAESGRVAGRFFDQHVRSAPRSRLFVQTVRRRGRRHLSVIEVTGFDILAMLEQYCAQSEQAAARFFEGAGNEHLMLMALPGVDEDWLCGLTREAAIEFARDPSLSLIERRPVAFGCQCTPERILEITVGIFRDDPAELFAQDDRVEVNCPRCGRSYVLTREDFTEGLTRQRASGERGQPPDDDHAP